MDRYIKIQALKRKLIKGIGDDCMNHDSIIGLCGSYGRGDFLYNSNLDVMFIDEEIPYALKNECISNLFPEYRTRIHEFEECRLFCNDKNSIILRILYLTETIPCIHIDMYWKLYHRILDTIRYLKMDPSELIAYKSASVNIQSRRKAERVHSLLPLQIEYAEKLKLHVDSTIIEKTEGLSFLEKYNLFSREEIHEL